MGGRGGRRLEATRLLGVALLCVLAQFAVAMPEGYFGPQDAITPFGLRYSVGLILLACVGAWAQLEGHRWALGFALLFYSTNIGLFMPALESDPVRASALICWMLLGVARQLFPYRAAEDHPRGDELAAWRAAWAPSVTQLALVSLVTTSSVVGFKISAAPPAQAVCGVFCAGTLVMAAPLVVRMARRRSALALAVPIPCALAIALGALGQPGAAFVALATAQALVLALTWAGEQVTDELLRYFYAHPALLTCLTFAAQVLLGTLFLSFPAAAADGHRVSPVDALFTSTSASCVTGLIVLDTPTAFSTFGHVVILALIQLGGLNIMVLSTFAALALGRRLGLRGEVALATVLDLPAHRTAYDVTRFIVLATLVIEGVGAALLGVAFSLHGASPGEAAWKGVFHSISAFCNAGFALQTDNVVLFQDDPAALFVIAALVVLGGLGFTVLASAWMVLRRERGPMPLQAKLALLVSAVLIVVGALLYAAVEWRASLAGLSPLHKVTNAVFQSVITRTAGFNSVDVTTMTSTTLLVCCVLMLIGASPGSTGGGIKTTTFAVLVGTVVSALRGGAPIVLFRRTIPVALAYRSAAVFLATVGLACAGLFTLLLTQRSSFERLLFEVCSALGTVGLTVGATAELDGLGKLVVAFLMYAGRVGPLTVMLLFGGAPPQGRLGYPDAKLMIG